MKITNKLGKTLLWATAVIMVFSGCAPKNAEPISTATLPGPEVIISNTETAVPTPTVLEATSVTPTEVTFNVPQNRTHYQLALILNYYTHFGTVTQTITYTNRTQQSLSEVLLVVPPKYYTDSFILRSLTGGEAEAQLEARYDGVNMYVQMQPALELGETTKINLTYQLNFPTREGTFGVSGRQTNLSNWYPYIPPYNEETGWVFHPQQVEDNMVVGEYVVNEISDFDVTLQLTDREELIEIAASAPGVKKDGVWSYHLELARGFSFSVSDSYVEHEITVDGVRIRSYCFHEHIPAGEAVTKIAANALKLFGDLYYPYPREMLSIVVADFVHNMEMDGMVMISYGVFDFYDQTPKTNLTILTPHEVSHQWFYSQVGNDQATEPWLDEALATYHEVLYYQQYHPDLVQWWWDNRISGFSPQGYVNSDIYIAGGYPSYRDAVYLRGAMFIQEIRDTIGDEAFFAALKDYAITNTYGIANRDNFFDAIAKYSQADLNLIMNKYFSN
ncbi:MAG: M1 family metallopeptidase [Anaerolineaceae bacterium]